MANQYDPYEGNTNIQGNDAPESEKAGNKDQSKAAAAALVGTAALGGAAYGLSKFMEEGEGDQVGLGDHNDPQGEVVIVPDKPASASTIPPESGQDLETEKEPRWPITDDMTFEEAFAAARYHEGPGHFFRWHGNVYHTHLDSEWDGMDANERLALTDKLNNDPEFGPNNPNGVRGQAYAHTTPQATSREHTTDAAEADIQLEKTPETSPERYSAAPHTSETADITLEPAAGSENDIALIDQDDIVLDDAENDEDGVRGMGSYDVTANDDTNPDFDTNPDTYDHA